MRHLHVFARKQPDPYRKLFWVNSVFIRVGGEWLLACDDEDATSKELDGAMAACCGKTGWHIMSASDSYAALADLRQSLVRFKPE